MTASAPLNHRRDLLKLAAAAAFSPVIARALEAKPHRVTGTLKDVEHVVILMQENRSFDHYFGSLRGVRGFSDPRAISLPGGGSVFKQTGKDGRVYPPFHLDATTTRAQSIFSLDHSWKGSHDAWKHYDQWARLKSPMTMGFFTRDDLPFYYALADAFTLADGYHASIHGPTNPNRMFLFSGTSGLSVGRDGPTAIINPPEEPNETADPKNDGPKFAGLDWTTYAERLEKAKVSWKLYQEYDNYGDNGLAYFKAFRGLDPSSPLYQKGRAWVEGSTPANAKTSQGEHLVSAFEADIAAGRLPQVSWIVAPYKLCEHPEASPAAGESLTQRLLAALVAHPEVWSRTVFLLNYDENDGFFDHVPAPTPPTLPGLGKSTVSLAGEDFHGVPVGLGPRVPLMAISPWSKGGYVNSETFDHTSVIRFLEARFGVMEPQITPWRRAVCGDLTSLFDFEADEPGFSMSGLPDAVELAAAAEAARTLPWPKPWPDGPLPLQESGQRPARALPYDLAAEGRISSDGFHVRLENKGSAGAAFRVASRDGQGPWYYALGAGKAVEEVIPLKPDAPYDLELSGPAGFYRAFAGARQGGAVEMQLRWDRPRESLRATLSNHGSEPVRARLTNGYVAGEPQVFSLKAGESVSVPVDVGGSDHWYDLALAVEGQEGFVRRFCGHVETGRPSRSDPGIGRG